MEDIQPTSIAGFKLTVDKEYERVYKASADWMIKLSQLSNKIIGSISYWVSWIFRDVNWERYVLICYFGVYPFNSVSQLSIGGCPS